MDMQLYERLCDPRFLFDAWRHVARKKGCSGADGESVQSFGNKVEKNITNMARELQTGDYFPSPLRCALISREGKKGFRRLGIPCVRDRVVFQGVNMLLQKLWNDFFPPLSFAYRNGRGVSEAMGTVVHLLRQGRFRYARGDIRGCFDSLDWGILSALLKTWLPDEKLRALVNRALRVSVVEGGHIRSRTRGVPQGSPLSPILSNLYLYPFDRGMIARKFPMVRYADDWLILTSSEEEAAEAFRTADGLLSTLLVSVNREKSGIGSLEEESVVFLGHKIDSARIDAGPRGWQRFAQAISALKTASSPEKQIQARAELSSIKAYYRHAGRIT